MHKIALRAADVSLLLLADGGLPEVVHWGQALDLDEATFDALAFAKEYPIVPSGADVPLRVAVIPEARFGWMGRPGLVGSRQGRDWTPAWELKQVRVDGNPVDGFVAEGASAEFDALADGLALTITVELLAQGLVRAKALLTNTGHETFEVQELTLAFPVPQEARELLDFAGRWGVERAPQRRAFTTGQHRREGRHGRAGHDATYILHAGVPGFGFAGGEVWSVHTAWSSNHLHYAEKDYIGEQVIGGGELLLPGEGRLGERESYETPWVYFNYGVGLDAVANRFHDFLRARAAHPDADRPVTLNVWEAVYFDHDLDRLSELADVAAKLGVERYVLDDGWFGSRRDDSAGLGDWVVSPEVWPNGLHPLIERVKGLGMQFGLWIEPEMINEDSDLARAHPEWIMQPAGRLPVRSRHQQVLNLAIPEAFAHVRDQLLAIFDEYPIDYVKWDHNRDLIDAGSTMDGAAAVHLQTLAFYRLLDELRAAHPHIEFESCASGGGRIDLEVLQRTERVWVSDNIDPESRQRMLLWTTQLIPPEMMGSHVASGRSHTTGRWHDLNFRAATAVFGHFGIEWDLTQATAEELDQLGGWIEWYKQARPVFRAGRTVRIDMPDQGVVFKGVITPDRAIYSLSVLEVPASANLGRLRFPGLESNARYRVKLLDHQLVPPVLWVPWRHGEIVLTGAALATVGVRAPMMQPATAVLFDIEKV